MVSSEVKRTIVKSAPELWSELSDPAALARHLGEFGEIRITRLETESAIEWESDSASGSVLIKASGWGTRVTLRASRELPEAEGEAQPGDEHATADAPAAACAPAAADAPAAACEPAAADEPAGAGEPAAGDEPVAADTPAGAGAPAVADQFDSTAESELGAERSSETQLHGAREPEAECVAETLAASHPAEITADDHYLAADQAPASEGWGAQQVPAAETWAAQLIEAATDATPDLTQEHADDVPPQPLQEATEGLPEHVPPARLGFFARLFRRRRSELPDQEQMSAEPVTAHSDAPEQDSMVAEHSEPPEAEADLDPSFEVAAAEAWHEPLEPDQPSVEPAFGPTEEPDPEPAVEGAAAHAAPEALEPQPGPETVESHAQIARQELATEQVTAVLSSMLDSLGTAHHRPFSRA